MGHNLGIMTHKILLLGANGQVGHALQTTLKPLGEVVCCTREQLDLSTLASQPDALDMLVRRVKPTIIVNASAYTAVDRAEAEPELAMLLNAQVPGLLGAAAQAVGACVVHYSTDYVFDGKKAGAYTETDQTNPLSVYGRSKLDGERLLSQSCSRSIVLRTSWVVGAVGGNFLKTMLKFAQERDVLRIVSDQQGAPTSANLLAQTTADVLRVMAEQPATDPRWGVYHLVAAGQTNWHSYASYVIAQARALGWPIKIKDEAITPILTAEYPVAATRPLNSVLDTSKIRKTFGVNLPDWQVGVDEVLQTLSRLR
jgi:dTDP-4-dehydrorhamnose reductase